MISNEIEALSLREGSNFSWTGVHNLVTILIGKNAYSAAICRSPDPAFPRTRARTIKQKQLSHMSRTLEIFLPVF